MYDPENKALRRRVERRYITQLLTGCGTSWCRNEYCKTGRTHLEKAPEDNKMDTRKAIEMARPFVDTFAHRQNPLHFCVDQQSQERRVLARMLVAAADDDAHDDGYALEWCVLALEKEGGDLERARAWLKDWAPRKGEERGR